MCVWWCCIIRMRTWWVRGGWIKLDIQMWENNYQGYATVWCQCCERQDTDRWWWGKGGMEETNWKWRQELPWIYLTVHEENDVIHTRIDRCCYECCYCSHYDLDGPNDGSDDLHLYLGRDDVQRYGVIRVWMMTYSQTKKSSDEGVVTNGLIETHMGEGC